MLHGSAKAKEFRHRSISGALLLLLPALTFLGGCQGASVGGSSQQQQPGTLSAATASLNFGSVAAHKDSSLSETLTNTGGSALVISAITMSGSAFSLSGFTAPVTLDVGQSTSFHVSFAPTEVASASGDVTITSNASNPTLTIPLSGTGVSQPGQLGASPATLALGSVAIGGSATATGTLTAGDASVTVTAASTNEESVFSVSGFSLPLTISAGQSVQFTVTFTPQATGAATATLTFSSDAASPSTTEALTGTGTAAATHTVNLSWEASSSANISGYNIYRAAYSGSCGSFARINSQLDTSTGYSDATVANGSSYCYGVKAVNSGDEQSSYSNILSDVTIPSD